MVRRLLPGMIAALVLLLPTSALAGGEINLFYGQKSLDDDDWGPMDTHQAIGLELTFGHEWPVAVAIDFFKTEDDATYYGYKVTGETQEIDGGVRYLFRKHPEDWPNGIRLGVALTATGELAEAEEVLRAVVAIQPNNPTALQDLAAVLDRRKKYREAETLLKRADSLR